MNGRFFLRARNLFMMKSKRAQTKNSEATIWIILIFLFLAGGALVLFHHHQ